MIDDLLSLASDALVPAKKIKIGSRHIGKIILDVVRSERHSSQLTIAKNPVEDGSVIADHAVLSPKSLTITGLVVDYEAPKAETPTYKKFEKLFSSKKLDSATLKLAVELGNFTVNTVKKINKSGWVGLYDVVGEEIRIIAKQAPDSGLLGEMCGKDFTPSDNRVIRVYQSLLAAQRSGAPVTLGTGIYEYANIMITGIAVSQTQNGSAEFTISLEEIFIVQTEMIDGVSVPKTGDTSPAGKEKAPKPKVQTGSKKNSGKKNTKKPPKSRNKKCGCCTPCSCAKKSGKSK